MSNVAKLIEETALELVELYAPTSDTSVFSRIGLYRQASMENRIVIIGFFRSDKTSFEVFRHSGETSIDATIAWLMEK